MKLPYSERELIDIISQALKDEAWENNRTGWYDKFADDSGLGEDAIKTWVYKKNAPSLHNFLTAIANLPADFGNKIFAGTGYRLVPDGSDEIDAARVKEALATLLIGFDALSADARKVLADVSPEISRLIEQSTDKREDAA